eukprot:CAMPEP_0201879182 /NCGR_PEP_ID=MMETSP0902-20130614/10131_1 /ASSEMBLY_ACC=CAM_ASM_000551 /TAXON_ID=420261 /ORGANISM="Thalassiosira antarctica, Strain CCMP982" /LENGTH=948 /DNA_ID=CAMNT_0048406955 /DNA_START=23 /DNA_END=2869 /DNA_ORIENTATION=-
MTSPISKISAFDVVATDDVKPSQAIQATSTNTKKVQFSMRGEEARQRAIARQKRILSNASLRLEAISDTSLKNMEAGQKQSKKAASDRVLADKMASLRLNAISDKTSLCNILEEVISSREESGQKMALSSPDDFPSKESSKEVASRERIVSSPDNDFLATSSSSYSLISQSSSSVSAMTAASSVPSPSKGGMGEGKSSVSSTIMFHESPTKLVDQEEEKVKVTKLPPTVVEETEQAVVEQLSANTSHPSKPQVEEPNSENIIQFFVLLLCPTSRIFELIEISAADDPNNDSNINDVLSLIPQKCTDERLLQQRYVGFVRPADRVDFMELHAKAFGTTSASVDQQQRHAQEQDGQKDDSFGDENTDCWPSLNTIHENDVLVAILDGYSGYQMSKISKPIIRNSKFREMIRRRSKKGGTRKKGSGSSNQWDNDERSMRSNRSSRSNRSTRSSRRRKHKGSRQSKGDRSVVPVVDCLPVEIDSKNHHEHSTVISGASFGKPPSSANLSANITNDGKENNRYTSLCQKLEHLSRKLHDVDDEIMAGDVSVAGSMLSIAFEEDADATREAADITMESAAVQEAPPADVSAANTSFKMTPNMAVYEITANIEDIFADHNVEIIAVDAGDDDSDDDTFATARSRRSTKSMRSVRSLVRGFEPLLSEDSKPLLEITTKKRSPRKPRKSRPSKFESFEEDDLMLQIEAMAKQADDAFESRKGKPRSRAGSIVDSAIIEPLIIESPNIHVIDEETTFEEIGSVIAEPKIHVIDEDEMTGGMTSSEAQPNIRKGITESNDAKEATDSNNNKKKVRVSFDDKINVTPAEVLGVMESITEGGPSSSMVVDAVSTYTATSSQQDTGTLSRNFLNTSTTMVSTMVAGSQGTVNEVHVLQYLGVTIVCLAANFMQQQAGQRQTNVPSPGGGLNNPFGSREVFQSAMFLAFMVNGQRYLAKVTQK